MRNLVTLAITVISLASCATAQRNNIDIFARDGLMPASRVPSSAPVKFTPPADSVFQDVSDYATKHHYFGYDVLACMDATNAKLKLGGTAHWGGTMELFMDYAAGRMDVGKFTKSSDGDGAVQSYAFGGLTFTMTAKGGSENIAFYSAQMSDKDGRGSEPLLCYLRSSGLE